MTTDTGGGGLLGARFRMTDPREARYRLAPSDAAPPDFSRPVDLTPWAPPIWDQGQTGSCVAQAYARALHVLAVSFGLDPDPVATSREWAYARCRQREGVPLSQDIGTIPQDMADLLLEGIIKESLWPWDGNATNDMPASVDADAPNQRWMSRHAGIYATDPGGLRAGIVSALQAGYPVPLGVNWYGQFDNVRADGSMPWPLTSRQRGGHEICCLHFEPAAAGQQERYWCDNSWTARWGNQGRFFFTGDQIASSAIVMDARAVIPAAVTPQPPPEEDPRKAFWEWFGPTAEYAAGSHDLEQLRIISQGISDWWPWLAGTVRQAPPVPGRGGANG